MSANARICSSVRDASAVVVCSPLSYPKCSQTRSRILSIVPRTRCFVHIFIVAASGSTASESRSTWVVLMIVTIVNTIFDYTENFWNANFYTCTNNPEEYSMWLSSTVAMYSSRRYRVCDRTRGEYGGYLLLASRRIIFLPGALDVVFVAPSRSPQEVNSPLEFTHIVNAPL